MITIKKNQILGVLLLTHALSNAANQSTSGIITNTTTTPSTPTNGLITVNPTPVVNSVVPTTNIPPIMATPTTMTMPVIISPNSTPAVTPPNPMVTTPTIITNPAPVTPTIVTPSPTPVIAAPAVTPPSPMVITPTIVTNPTPETPTPTPVITTPTVVNPPMAIPSSNTSTSNVLNADLKSKEINNNAPVFTIKVGESYTFNGPAGTEIFPKQSDLDRKKKKDKLDSTAILVEISNNRTTLTATGVRESTPMEEPYPILIKKEIHGNDKKHEDFITIARVRVVKAS